jgi:hypothetical protein
MNQNDVAYLLAKKYISEFHPDQLENLDEANVLINSNINISLPPIQSDRFAPPEIISSIIAPIVLGIISAWLYDLIKNNLSKKEEKTKIELIEIHQILKSNQKLLKKIEKRLSKQTQNPDLVRNVLEHCIDYLEIIYGQNKS